MTAPLDERDAGTAVQRRRGGDRPILGLLLIGLGTLWFLESAHLLALSAETALAAILMILGLGLVLTARRGRRHWPILLGAILSLVLIANSSSLDFNVRRIGEQSFQPTSAAELQRSYQAAFGDMTVDLTRLQPSDLKDALISVKHGFGHVVVRVPPGVDVHVDGQVGLGQLVVCGVQVASGPGINRHVDNQTAGGALVTIRIHQGVGDAEVAGCQKAAGSTPSTTTAPTSTA